MATLERIDPLLQGNDQAAHRRRIGAWHAGRGRAEPAIAAYRSALEAQPGDLEALEALEEQLDQAGRWHDLADVRRDLARGPARLCEAFGIDRELDGWDLSRGHELWISEMTGPALPPTEITVTTRVGISPARNLPLRFFVTDSRFVSKPARTGSGRRRPVKSK